MPKLVVSASLLAKSQVAQYTRKDGVVVSAHENGRMAAAPKPTTPDAVKHHAVASGAKFRTNVSVFSKPELAHSFADKIKGAKGGAFVMSHPGHDHHVVVSGADAMRMEKNGYRYAKPGQDYAHGGAAPKPATKVGVRASAAKKAAPTKTGSEAPAKMVNVGSEK